MLIFLLFIVSLFLSTLSLRRATFSARSGFCRPRHFYPRSPCGERRRLRAVQNTQIDISIHALLAESDGLGFCYYCDDFAFLSTLSLRRATSTLHNILELFAISIHALLAESDLGNVAVELPTWNFYPRSPCGERQTYNRDTALLSIISIHALLAESDHIIRYTVDFHANFYPRSPCGERRN